MAPRLTVPALLIATTFALVGFLRSAPGSASAAKPSAANLAATAVVAAQAAAAQTPDGQPAFTGLPAAKAPAARPPLVALPAVAPVPDSALAALREGRFFRASFILRAYLRTRSDSVPADLLTAAEAEAGWGDWAEVQRLLEGRPWLDQEAGGRGWHLLGQAHMARDRVGQGRAALERFLRVASAASDRERGLAEIRLARAALRADDHAAALAAWDRAAALLPSVADWLALQGAGVAAAAGDTAAVRTHLADLDTEVADAFGWRTRVRAYRQAEDPAAAVAVATAAAERLAGAGDRAGAWALAGEAALEGGDTATARSAFLRAVDASRASGGALTAARNLDALGGLDLDQRRDVALTWLRHGNTSRARTGIEAWLNGGRGTAVERDELRLALGRGLFNAGDYAAAETFLTRVADGEALSAAVRAEALYTVARAQYRAGRVAEARRTLAQVAERFPGQEGAAQALYLTADLDQDDVRPAQAEANFRRATEVPADAEQVGLSWMRLGGLLVQQGRSAEALEAFEGYRAAYPTGRRWQQATYWAALLHAEAGDSVAARERLRAIRARDPFSYYGGQAAELLGERVLDIPMGAAPPADSALAGRIEGALARVDLLREAGLETEAAFELDRVRRRFAPVAGSDYPMAEALNARGFTTAGIGLGWEVFRREGAWNPRLLRIIYPFPFREIVVAEARERGVDPFLAAALIRQESMFNPRAVSGAGAIGLMQVMPETGATVARGLGVRNFDPDMLKRGEFNVHLGMRYLADQLREYDGRLPLVLSAYNAGPTRVDRWSAFPEIVNDEWFTERIPFTETRDYVKIVQQNARMYRGLYE